MAKNLTNTIIHGVSGKFGDQIVFRQVNGNTLLCKPPVRGGEASPKQLEQQDRFTKAAQLSGETITKVADEIGSLPDLTSLGLIGPSLSNATKFLTTLPETIGNLTNLQKLDVSNNALTALPSSMANLKNLKELHIQMNNFSVFPTVVTSITSLESFTSYGNKIPLSNVPLSFSNLINLKRLFFSEENMKITDPQLFSKMSQLNVLYLGNMQTPAYIDLSKNSLLSSVYMQSYQLQIVNLKNGNNAALSSGSYSSVGGYNGSLKCVAVDSPPRATAGVAPYQNIHFYFINNVNNFQSDCSSYLSTSEVKLSDIKIANPVKDFLTIQSREKINTVEIFDISGRLVKTFKTAGGIVADLAKGVYILKLHTDNGISTQKIIKE